MKRLIFPFLFCTTVAVVAQQMNLVQYDIRSGLPSLSLQKIFIDNHSILWIATRTGRLIQFDGKEFSQLPGVQFEEPVSWISESPAGDIFVLTGDRLFRYDGISVHAIPSPPGILSQNAKLMLAGNTLYIGSETGIFKYNTTTPGQQFETLGSMYVLGFKINNGEIWVWGDDAVYIYTLDGFRLLRMNPYGHYDTGVVKTVFSDRERAYLVYESGRIIAREPDGEVVEMHHGLRSVQSVIEGATGDVWIAGGSEGIAVCNSSGIRIASIDQTNGLSQGTVSDISFDNAGQLWIATSDAGLFKYLGQRIETFSVQHPVKIILPDQQGNIWAFTGNGLFTNLNATGGPWGTFSYGDLSVNLIDAAIDYNKILWLLEEHGQLWSISLTSVRDSLQTPDRKINLDKAAIRFFKEDHLQALDLPSEERASIRNSIHAIKTDYRGNIHFISGDGQILRFARPLPGYPGFSQELKQLFALPAGSQVLHFDREGKIWYNNHARLEVYWPLQDSSVTLEIRHPVDLFEDASGIMWVASRNGELYLVEGYKTEIEVTLAGNTLHTFTGEVYQMTGKGETLWLGVGDRIERMTISGLKKGITKQEWYGAKEGYEYPGDPTHLKQVADSKGNLIVVSNRSVWRFRLGTSSGYGPPSEPFITGIQILNKDILLTKYRENVGSRFSQIRHLDFGATEHSIRINLSVSSLISNPVEYQWQLNDDEKEWRSAGASGEFQFSRLKHGDYRLHVRVCDPNGVCTAMQQPVHFSIAPHLWERNGFKLAALLAVLTGGFFAGRQRMRYKQRELEQASREMAMRNQLMDLEQKALRLQMNPHFLFNVLQIIHARIQNGDLEVAAKSIQGFGRLVRLVLEHARQQEVSLEEELELAEEYMRAENLCHPFGFMFTVTIDPDIEPESILIPPMLVQPFLENAVRHGIGKMQGGKITMDIRQDPSLLIFTITDNGMGIDHTTKSDHKSVALELVAERLRLNGQVGGYTFVEPSEKVDSHEGAGTIVKLSIPFRLPEARDLHTSRKS